jgi:uncharacterized protein (TIGR02594 family)
MLFSRDFESAPWMEPALACLGLHGPPNDSFFQHRIGRRAVFPAAARGKPVPPVAATPVAMEFFQSVNDGTYGEDWCAAFVNWCLAKKNIERTHSCGARYFLPWGKVVMPTWGCITVLYSGGHESTHKHVGFLVDQRGNEVLILGGNQRVHPHSNSDHAVTFSRRRVEDVEACRWPKALAVPVLTNTGKHLVW